jgi:hypothetical protein
MFSDGVMGSAAMVDLRYVGAALTACSAAVADTIDIPASRDNTLYQSNTGALSNALGSGFVVGRNATGLTGAP